MFLLDFDPDTVVYHQVFYWISWAKQHNKTSQTKELHLEVTSLALIQGKYIARTRNYAFILDLKTKSR